VMKKLKSAIEFVFGENESYSLEQRLFISALIIGIFLGIVGTITNYFLFASIVAIIIPVCISIILVVFYYFVRIKGFFKPLALPIIFFALIGLAFLWYNNGGIDGSNDSIFIIGLILGLIIVEPNKKIIVLSFFILIKAILYFIQLYRPELITPFPSENARWLDVFTTSIYITILIYLIINFLHKNYALERNKLEESKKELQELNLKLNESNKSKDMFFSIISHDLKSPFSSIIGLSEILAQNINEFDKEKIQQIADNINKSANETFLLLENLLKWSRLQRGIIIPNFGNHNLSKIVNNVCVLYREVAKTKEISIINKIAGDVSIYCDEEIIKTILRNLVANAIKFTEPKGLVILSATESKGLVEIEVSDSGVGIATDKLPELFSIDKNNSTKGTSNESGTGLGLHLCRALIETHGGKIWVESEVGKGSSFYISVTRVIESEKENALVFQN